MQERWNKLKILVFLGALRSEFSKALTNVIDNSTVKSFEDTYHSLCEAISLESQNLASVESHDCSVLAVQGKTIRDRGCGRGRAGGCSRGRVENVIYCYYCKEARPHQVQLSTTARDATVAVRSTHIATIRE